MTQTYNMSDTLTILPIPILRDNYVWIIIDKLTHQAVIIDPGEADPVIQFLKEKHLTLSAVLVTHHHWDHTNGIPTLQHTFGCPIIGNIELATQFVGEGATLSIEAFPLTLQVMAIPGHTLKHLAYYSSNMVFCGDTLFAAGCGRLFEGTAEQLFGSLQKISSLPDETKIYCAHEYTLNNLHFAKLVEPSNQDILKKIALVETMRQENLPSLPSSIAEEKNTNPFLRCHIPEVIESAKRYAGKNLKHPVEVFAALRQWKDQF